MANLADPVPNRHRPWLPLRMSFGFAFAALYLVVARPSSPSILGVSATLVVIGAALRSWTAGYLFKGKRAAVGGPYAFVRNPLSLASFILGLGFCLALYRQPLLPVVIALWTAYVLGFSLVLPATSKAEEKELARSLGAPYEQYVARVPRFLPWRGRVANLGEQHFSTELYRRNREYQCWLGCAAVQAYLWARYALAR